jgi:S1-C subfamily serine protease
VRVTRGSKFRNRPTPLVNVRLAFCCLPFAFYLQLMALAEDAPSPFDPARAVVQLVAIGPGAGEKKQECAATGFLISAEGHILTNAHVVEDARRCLASSPGAKIVAKFGSGDGRAAEALACDVIAKDEDRDLAILRTDSAPPADWRLVPLRLRREPVPVGTRVWVTGHPSFRWEAKTYSGRVVALRSMALNGSRSPHAEVLVLDIPLRRGASGSPVYIDSGEVIGIIERQGTDRLETVAVRSSEAVKLLEAQDAFPAAVH